MSIGKSLIISIVFFSFIVQIGNIILKNTKFEDIFKCFSGIFFIIMIASNLLTNINIFKINNSNSILGDINYATQDSENIINSFQNNLSSIIENDLHNSYYVNVNVEVKTNLKSIQIYIKGLGLCENTNEIINYVKSKYCNPSDEVVLINEYSR